MEMWLFEKLETKHSTTKKNQGKRKTKRFSLKLQELTLKFCYSLIHKLLYHTSIKKGCIKTNIFKRKLSTCDCFIEWNSFYA